MTEFAVRQATEQDLPDLLHLYQHLTPGDEVPDLADACTHLQRLRLYAGSAIFVGERDGKLVTTCTLIVIPNLTRGGSPYALIENVVTHESHRKQSYGRRVLEDAIETAWQHGCYKVMLLTGRQDPGVHTFYKAVGFEQSKVGFQIRRPQAAS